MLKTVFLDGQSNERPTENGASLPRGKSCAFLLGGFDGVHIGHRVLLEKARATGLPVGLMTIAGGKGTDLFTFAEREAIFSSLGAAFVFELPFAEIKDLSSAAFADLLKKNFAPRAFFCGEDFRFGRAAEGTPDFLSRYTGLPVDVSELVTADGEKIGTSSVKTLLAAGDAAGAARLLGAPFFLRGRVVRDRQVGRTIGFPTANIPYPPDKFPLKKGVYEAAATVDGRDYKGIVNFGDRPTFGNGEVTTETYLDGFSGDLYGRTIDVRFIRFLREIRRFASAEELRTQLFADSERVRTGR